MAPSPVTRPRILSGMRPTGPLHWGNYFGALKNWVTLQDRYDCYFSIADWHSLTTDYADPGKIAEWRREVLLDWLAAGLDPDRSVLFVQSRVPEHAELHLLLSMVTPLGWLERVPSYKEMREQLTSKDLNTYGFLGYPVLQTSDIVMYKPSCVPVGEDQVSHVELTREIVRRFHFLYKREVFPEPQVLLTPTARVPGLDRRKMSKSYGNAIYLKDDPATIREKIMPAITDPARKRRQDPGDPDICLIFDYHRLFSDDATRAHVDRECRRAGIGCVEDKHLLLEKIEAVMAPIRERREALARNEKKLARILDDGTMRARAIARQTMAEVREIMGL
ncbi:MAG: tryptophan--tRNA ligase [Deltaproteobacteria bacterium]|nr:tryptophan--tRNA ligase [Deltaproteobacteria bacterium]